MSDHRFIEQLVRDEVLRPEIGARAIELLAISTCRADSVLLQMDAMDEVTLLEALARFQHSRPIRPLDLVGVPAEVIRLLPPRAAQRYEVVPFRLEGRTLAVASLRPGDLLIEDEVALLTGCRVSSFAALEVRLYEALASYYAVELPVSLESISRRLAGTAPAPARPVRVARSSATSQAPSQAPPSTAPSEPAPPAVPARPFRGQGRPGDTELEISAEELELFPSLSGGAATAGAAPAPPTRDGGPTPEAPEPAPPGAQPSSASVSIEDRLADAADILQRAELREDIADALLGFASGYFRRRALLIVRKENVVGWRGEGEEVDAEAVRAVSIPVGEPSVFYGLFQGAGFWLGALPAMPHNAALVLGLGGLEPAGCVIVPIALRGKVIAFLYGDNGADGVAGAPLAELRRLAHKAAIAFEVYILKNKIRTA